MRKIVLSLLSAAFALFAFSSCAQGEHEVISLITRYDVKQGNQERFRKTLADYVKQAIAYEGNVMAEAYYEQENPLVLWVVERWDNKGELNSARESGQFKAIELLARKALIKPAQVTYVKDLEPLSKEQWRKVAARQDKPITIMLFVDAKAGTETDFKEVYHTAMPQFRAEPGVINYQLSQFEEDSARFVTYEKFKDEAGFQYHLNFPPIQPVIDYLNTNIKKQPFQSGLHRLIEFSPITRE
jgi:quinol monooxygenase YgiN